MMIKPYPLLLNRWQVKSILNGSAHLTHRLIKPLPCSVNGVWRWKPNRKLDLRIDDHALTAYYCPFGRAGTIFYGKETHAFMWPDSCEDGFIYDEDPTGRPITDRECKVEYRADLPDGDTDYPGGWPAENARGDDEAPKWKPSSNMPMFAARIWLEITSIKVVRWDGLWEADFAAEGYTGNRVQRTKELFPRGMEISQWLWAIAFKRASKPEGIV